MARLRLTRLIALTAGMATIGSLAVGYLAWRYPVTFKPKPDTTAADEGKAPQSEAASISPSAGQRSPALPPAPLKAGKSGADPSSINVGNVRSKGQSGGTTAGVINEGGDAGERSTAVTIGDVSSEGQTGGTTAGYVNKSQQDEPK